MNNYDRSIKYRFPINPDLQVVNFKIPQFQLFGVEKKSNGFDLNVTLIKYILPRVI